MTKTAGRLSLATVLVLATVTFGAGVAWKSYCAGGNWSDTRQYTTACYSDIIPLLGTEQLTAGRLPYIDACAKQDAAGNDLPLCDEYPVLTMYFMRVAASLSGPSAAGFFWTNVVMLWICAMVVVACCYLLVGRRALYVALAPTLLLSGALNWDLFAIALSMVGVLAFFTRRDTRSGACLGLGAAAKFFPALLVIPLVVDRVRSREADRGITMAWSAGAAWLGANIPFALLGLVGWLEFFRFNSSRGADYDSLWYIAYRLVGGHAYDHTKLINLASAAAFAGLVALIWVLKARKHPTFARWTLCFPILVVFLLTNKVYSPQYSLWLLPWFALALPNIWGFAAFQVADVLVYLTRFKWFASLSGVPGTSEWVFETMLGLRALALIGCLVAWVWFQAPALPIRASPVAAGGKGGETERDSAPIPV
ncbi:MAG: glycosyltransferase 87 family protein [Actinomycetota bacterium]